MRHGRRNCSKGAQVAERSAFILHPSSFHLLPVSSPPMNDRPADPQSRHALRIWLAPMAWVIGVILVLFFFQPLSTVALGVLAACIIACTLYPLMDYIPGPRGL